MQVRRDRVAERVGNHLIAEPRLGPQPAPCGLDVGQRAAVQLHQMPTAYRSRSMGAARAPGARRAAPWRSWPARRVEVDVPAIEVHLVAGQIQDGARTGAGAECQQQEHRDVVRFGSGQRPQPSRAPRSRARDRARPALHVDTCTGRSISCRFQARMMPARRSDRMRLM